MSRKPFFMRFVETQDKPAAVKTDVKAGAETRDRKPIRKDFETMKYPSDGDDGWPDDYTW